MTQDGLILKCSFEYLFFKTNMKIKHLLLTFDGS